MAVSSAEVLTERTTATTPGRVRDDLAVRITLEPRVAGGPMPEHEGQWVGRLRRIGTAKLRHWGLTSLVEDAQLVISELVTNALRYGSHEIAFRFLLTTDVLVIEVEDGSPGRPRVREASPDDENGRGLLLVVAIADDWGVTEDRLTTWATFRVPVGRP
jgi:anti-sigma regulatory factor (Ser/Thr protein kinase)